MQLIARATNRILAQGEAIRELNDRFRQTFAGGMVVVTAAIRALCATNQAAILAKVQTFDNFDAGNDPYQERDYGSFEHASVRCAWKIDYYAPNLEQLSDDPADAGRTVRVLTIMLTSEY